MTILNRRRLLQYGAAACGPAAARQPGLRPGRAAQGRLHADRHAQRQRLEPRPRQVGAEFMKEQLGDKVEFTVVEEVPEGPDCERVLRDLASQGHKLIFSTSFGYGDYVHQGRAAVPGRDLRARHGLSSAPPTSAPTTPASTRAARCCGTIAGHLTKTGKAGYVGSFPIPEVVHGHQLVHPRGAEDQPGLHDDAGLHLDLERSGQGSRRRPRA